MMLANHTCMSEIFRKALVQYDSLVSRNAYLHQFQGEHALFEDGIEEFANCREVVEHVMDEYVAAEGPDYAHFGGRSSKNDAERGSEATEEAIDPRSATRYASQAETY